MICTIYVAKTNTLVCILAFAYADCWFSGAADKIEMFDPLEALKYSKRDSMDYIAQFRVINPRQ